MSRNLLRVAAVLWVLWGLVHVLAGVMTMSQETPAAVAGIADAVDAAALAPRYHDAVGAVIHQHGWNLAWIGLTTIACAVAMWRGKRWGVFVAALCGGLADVGYFLFLDLGGYVHFVPGTVMTLVSGSAIALSFVATYRSDASDEAAAPPSAEAAAAAAPKA